jgi:hypothetical protein
MVLLHAPVSRRYGFQEPRTYLDMAPNTNYSIVNNLNREGKQRLLSNGLKMSKKTTTRFHRVRVSIVRLKNKKYKENIDCTDFTFATTSYQYKDKV